MASGPKTKPGCRFGGLSEVSLSEPNAKKKKHKKNETLLFDDFPDLPKITSSKNPRFIIIEPANEKQPLTAVSIFALRKAIDAISTEYEQISQLRDGRILILTKNQKVADKFLCKKTLSGLCSVSIKLHNQLNSSKGIVYAPCLINVSEQEIVSEMKSQNVTEVYKFTKIFESNPKPTGLMLFTFDAFQPPDTVEIGWYKTKVTEYFPNPMRCRNCQILGHIIKKCTNPTSICNTCNLPIHEDSVCIRQMCANCYSSHPADSKECPKYIQMKEILKIKTKKKCTMADAKRVYKEQNPIQINFSQNTFSNVIQSNIPKSNTNNITLPQTSNNSSSSIEKNPHSTVPVKGDTISHTIPQLQTGQAPTPPIEYPSSSTTNIENIKQSSINTIQPQITSQPTLNMNTLSTNKNVTLNTELNSPFANSPISQVTQNLIKSNNYFVEDDEDDESI